MRGSHPGAGHFVLGEGRLKPGGKMLTPPLVDPILTSLDFPRVPVLNDTLTQCSEGMALQVTHLQRWQLLGSSQSDLLQKSCPGYSLGFQPLWCSGVMRRGSLRALQWHEKLLYMQHVFAFPTTAHFSSLKGQSTVFHFVTNNNYLSNSLRWELALRSLLWLQEALQDAPNDALCYFSCAFLACKKQADSGAFIHQKILGYICLGWCRHLHLPLAFWC